MIVEEWRPFHRHLVVGVARVRNEFSAAVVEAVAAAFPEAWL
jgi:N-formylglutamate amidohydrolase